MRSTLRNKRKTREENWISDRLDAVRIFTRNSHRSASKLYTNQAQWLKILLVPFNWKSGNRSSNDPRLEFRVPDCNCHAVFSPAGRIASNQKRESGKVYFSFTEIRTSKQFFTQTQPLFCIFSKSTGLVYTNENYQGRGLCYLSNPRAEAVNTRYYAVKLFVTEVHLLCYLIC